MIDWYVSSGCIVEPEAYAKIRHIYASTCSNQHGPLMDIYKYQSMSDDTLPDWIRQNTIPLTLRIEDEEIEVMRGLYFESDSPIEITSLTTPLEREELRELIEKGIPIVAPYRRFAKLRAVGNNHRFEAAYINAILAHMGLHERRNTSEQVMDLFLLENLAKRR